MLGADLTAGVKVIAFAIAEHAGTHKLECWPGYRLLARETRLAERTVRAAVDRLVAVGFIETKTIWTGKKSAVRMTLTMPPSGITMPVCQGAGVSSPCQSVEGPTGTLMPIDRHAGARGTGTLVPPHIGEPEKEPEKEPETDGPLVPTAIGNTAEDLSRNVEIQVGRAAFIGLGFNFTAPPKIDGMHIDRFVVEKLRATSVWSSIFQRCSAGSLTVSSLMTALADHGIADAINSYLQRTEDEHAD